MPSLEDKWWLNSIFYQIYLPSFQDSNGDGIGDLRGVINRLDYLLTLGIDAIWITPFYESPKIDHGYDVSNHKSVDRDYGSMEDFDELIEEANRRNIKVIIDIILNHTSHKHPSFIESRWSCDSLKRDWYIWRDPNPDTGQEPNNWAGFESSSWTYDSKTQQYYYHFFYSQQPDLNWRNEEVISEMFDICKFWLSKGVSGLRLDAINFLIEDINFDDNDIVSCLPRHLQNIIQYCQSFDKNINHKDNHNVLKLLRKFIKKLFPEDPLLIGEIWVPKLSDIFEYYGNNNDEIQLPFNFFLSTIEELNPHEIRAIVKNYTTIVTEVISNDSYQNLPTTLVLSNHDFPRSTSRYSNIENSDPIAKLLAILQLTLRGIPFIYYGEEIGMRDLEPSTIDDVKDLRGKAHWPKYKGRDGCRRPMQWDSSKNAGFTTGEPWLSIDSNNIYRNVEYQSNNNQSVFSFYKRLIYLRKNNLAFTSGMFEFGQSDDHILAYYRYTKNDLFLILLNLNNNRQLYSHGDSRIYLYTWILIESTLPHDVYKIFAESIPLEPYEGLILKAEI